MPDPKETPVDPRKGRMATTDKPVKPKKVKKPKK